MKPIGSKYHNMIFQYAKVMLGSLGNKMENGKAEF